jgi:hypothetical protein
MWVKMNIFLDRIKFTETGIFGMMTWDGATLCFTLELPWKDNEHLVSCIPAGKYDCIKHDSAKFPNTWELLNVPDREEILIHTGNTMKDTHGCILVGDSMGEIDKHSAVKNSRLTMQKLRNELPDNFTLNIEE